MRQILQSRAIKSLCYALIMALVATFAPSPLTTPASAQLMGTYTVAVVDFYNESGVQGDTFARLATDAVVVEMSKTKGYDVSISRTSVKAEMDRLDLHSPLDKVGLVRLGEGLGADAMLQGSIKSVQLSGEGATRRASVTLVAQLIDQASGEVINGAIQTGNSSARVGYTPDNETLITEAINNAAFLCVKTMSDYVIPEATVQMNVGESEVILNKGARDGLKPGMRMIVLRQKEIIGYIQIRDMSPSDARAKVIKSMRGIQPEDKVRAIYEMPTVVGSAQTNQSLPSGPPSGSRSGSGGASKIGKLLIALLAIGGLAAMFNGGSGSGDAPSVSAPAPMTIGWDSSEYTKSSLFVEYQILRDGEPIPVWATTNKSAIRERKVWLANPNSITNNICGDAGDVMTVPYHTFTNTNSVPALASADVDVTEWGSTHTYTVAVIYQVTTGSTSEDGDTSATYQMTTYSSKAVVATAIQPVTAEDINILPANNDTVSLSNIETGDDNAKFGWSAVDGADIYQVVFNISSSKKKTFTVSPSADLCLSADQRAELAAWLTENTDSEVDTQITWHIDSRNTGDTCKKWVTGNTLRFTLESGLYGP